MSLPISDESKRTPATAFAPIACACSIGRGDRPRPGWVRHRVGRRKVERFFGSATWPTGCLSLARLSVSTSRHRMASHPFREAISFISILRTSNTCS